MDQDACNHAWEKEQQQRPEIGVFAKEIQKEYYDPMPNSLKWFGGTASLLYKKEVKIQIYKGFYIDLKDAGQGMIGYRFTF